MLTEYFKMNASNPETRKYLYREFPEYFTWNKSKKFWKSRVAKNRLQIKRLVYANPNEGKRYYLRVLLTHVRGAISYENLKTWHGVTHKTFRKAAKVMRFVETDKSIDECLTESAMFMMPCSLRRLFATIMVFYDERTRDHYKELTEEQNPGFD
ncbi:hypothetical protein SETIT_2G239400v2 [Setaria italica]|uniref:Uncharacterized protein n=1 Tax=Setaria italica TaxID=4555 RepID=A0A368Q2K5_SETIT|nr:hypothetical protein SETIT_2G239400v2 [Setaria italica]